MRERPRSKNREEQGAYWFIARLVQASFCGLQDASRENKEIFKTKQGGS